MIEITEIPIVELKKLIAYVKEHYKFDFSDYAMSSFKRRITRILQVYSLNTVENLIKRMEEKPDFYDELLREITVNTTEMFRAPSFWRKLREQVLPVIAGNNNIRIWSAACSSGEEVYSLAILLKEMNLLQQTKITASDINDKVLEKAKNGTYWARALEVNDRNYERFEGKFKLSDYYVQHGDNITFHKELIQNVTFKRFDLVQGIEFSKFDLILCRNVMIYFNPELQDKVVQLFSRSLFTKGFLAVGEKETIAFCRSAEKFETFSAEERIYRKTKE